MTLELQTTDNGKHSLYILGGAVLMGILVFLIIPLTHTSQSKAPETIDIREVLVMKPPTPAAPPRTTESPPVEEQTPKPVYQKQLTQPSPAQLELSLNPGIDEALAIGLTNAGFEMEADAVSDIKKLFTFKDLSEAPRIINYPKVRFPNELIRRGITEGSVIALIEIDEQGRAEIIRVNSSTHPLLIEGAEEIIRQAQFTRPLIDGVPQRVRGEWPISLRAPK
jgi:periplasmic protein TonB